MITDKEIQVAWLRYFCIHLQWVVIYLSGFFTGFVIICHFLKHVCKLGFKFWLLNDTKDGDFGTAAFIRLINSKKGLSAFRTLFGLFKLKKGLYSAFLWWWRNKAWNFYYLRKPFWSGGAVEDLRVIKCTIPEIYMIQNGKYNAFTKANRKNRIFGINYYAYRLNGKVFVSYSKATEKIEKQFGAGGNEWRCWIKPISAVFKL